MFNIVIKEIDCLSARRMRSEGCDFLGAHLQTALDSSGQVGLNISQTPSRLEIWRAAIPTRLIGAWFSGPMKMSSRQIASTVGRLLWRMTLPFRPFAECFEAVNILRRLPHKNWDDAFTLTEAEVCYLHGRWIWMARNVAHSCGEECDIDAPRIFLCSDSSDDGWGAAPKARPERDWVACGQNRFAAITSF